MKEIIYKYKLILIIILVITLGGYMISNYLVAQEELRLAKEKLNIKSDSEIITETIINKGKELNDVSNNIKVLELEESKLNLEVVCWKNQMNRLVDQLEYNLNYCNDVNNLSKFKEGLN